MIFAPQQLSIPSLAFDKDRSVLVVGEVALKWRVTDQHVIDLLEEGKLNGFDIAGRHDYIRVPAAAIDKLASQFRVPRESIMTLMTEAKPNRTTGRAHWRIPVKEGFEAYMRENHSLNL
jgi:hypothetical protein